MRVPGAWWWWWWVWAIPAVIAAGVGGGFLYDGAAAHDRLDQITAASSAYYLADAEAARARWRADTQTATIALAAAGALAITAVVMAATAPRAPRATPTTALAPTVFPGAATRGAAPALGVTWLRTF